MRDWFTRVIPEFSRVCEPFIGKPILYVEIGVWTGDSAEWTLKNVLTHPQARGVGIDSYQPDWKRDQAAIDKIALGTIERLKPYSCWQLICDKSQHVLPLWDMGKIDLLYIDGSHCAHDALMDFCYAWPHLKVGSRVIFDDFGVGHRWQEKSKLPNVPTATKAVEECFGPYIKTLYKHKNPRRQRQFSLEVVKHQVGELPY